MSHPPPQVSVAEPRLAPCTPTQAGIVLASLAGPRGVYVQQVVVTLPEAVDASRLEAAWQASVRGHDALRTSFDIDAAGPQQVVEPEVGVPLTVEDLGALDERAR